MRALFLDYGLAPPGSALLLGESWFGLRCIRQLFHLSCCTLGTFATEAAGKLAAIIRLNLGVVLSPRKRHLCEAVVKDPARNWRETSESRRGTQRRIAAGGRVRPYFSDVAMQVKRRP
jgi:hypothetical protein